MKRSFKRFSGIHFSGFPGNTREGSDEAFLEYREGMFVRVRAPTRRTGETSKKFAVYERIIPTGGHFLS